MQTTRQIIPEKKSALLSYLLVITAFFVLLEISFIIQCSGIYLGDVHLVASHLKVPALVIPGILFFIFAQLLVHLSFALIIWLLAIGIGKTFSSSVRQTEIMGFILWFTGLATVLIANRFFYPNSKYSTIFFNVFPRPVVQYTLIIMMLFFLLVIVLASYGFLRDLMKDKKNRVIYGLSALCIFLGAIIFAHRPPPVIADVATAEKPNIIIIGIDSLRPDYLSFFGDSQQTPHLDNFLTHATVFAEAVTPIARTFPSWSAILTGEYPKANHMRTDLSDFSHLDMKQTISTILQQQGYKTIYATDDTRFSNIDQHFGFEEVATPPMGFNDFLLGTLNDFPLSNLILNTKVGEYLFPHSFGNRPVFITYNPNSFLKLLQPRLAEPRAKPLFMVVHFCLTHYPYAWAALPVGKVSLYHYQASIVRVDEQFNDFMQLLKENNILQHSIVILLSDHGEGVERPGDRITAPDLFIAGKNNPKKIIPAFYPASADHEKVDRSGGHGTDILGLSQYHTVFAVRSFGTLANQEKVFPGLVSLMDIKPTLLQFLQLPSHGDGHSLSAEIFGHQSEIPMRPDLFTETDFSPEAVRSVHPEMRKVLFEGIDYFTINQRTARIVVKDSMLKMIISSKQYADYYGPWILALYPQTNKTMVPILVNLNTGQWTNALSTTFALQSPVAHMLRAMKNYYGTDLEPINLQ